MSRFAPPRASSPAKYTVSSGASALTRNLGDDSQSSALSVAPELIALTEEEIEFIDAVIERAPQNATTFLTVFKAYNDILQERGVDPQHEVVYYGKLLKLGTLKGKNWAEKWKFVKSQQIGATSKPKPKLEPKRQPLRSQPPAPTLTQTRKPITAPGRAALLTRLTGALKSIERDDDAFTLHSHQDDTEGAPTTSATTTTTTTKIDEYTHRDTPRPLRRAPSPALTTNTLGLNTGPAAKLANGLPKAPIFPSSKRTIAARSNTLWDAETSDNTTDTARSPSTVPPSYGAAVRGNDSPQHVPYHPLRALAQAQSKLAAGEKDIRPPSASGNHTKTAAAREAIMKARERKGSVLNEEDAWEKIRMAQDEKAADRWREERLVERCWDIWRQGYEWAVTTNEQAARGHDIQVLRLAIHRWRNRTAYHRQYYQHVASINDSRLLKFAFSIWKAKFRERKQAEWRNDMRARMKIVREKHEQKLVKDAWAKWRQAHGSHLAEQHYNEKLVRRFFKAWKARLVHLDELDATCDMFLEAKDHAQLEGCWDLWRRAAEMRRAERMLADRVALRVMASTFDVWKKRLRLHEIADRFYDRICMKRALGAWKASRDRIRTLENRANKHLARQNDVLIRAVMRVWKAHERGRLLERVRTLRVLREAWETWKRRLQYEREREDKAVTFYTRGSSALASSALRKWRERYTLYQNEYAKAVDYHSTQLRYNTMLVWRLQLRKKLKEAKKAKVAEKFFVMRNAWRTWQAKVQEKKREKLAKEFEKNVLKRYFEEWITRTQRSRELKLAEEVISQRVALRIMTNSLNHWTNRVADIKFLELETTQRYEQKLLAEAFKKWKALCIRHVEELSLMESYRDVKREETMRRMFHRWLTAARKARNRRILLQEKEEELKIQVMAAAWDKWRERYQDRRLQPLADHFILQRQRDILFRAFGIWHSKTKSLPAVRFQAQHLKAKYWKIWREAMPKAMDSKTARERDRKAVLTRAFNKWLQTYRTKLELKAVARARYLRLPTAMPRQTTVQSRSAPPASAASSLSSFARRNTRPASPAEDESDAAPSAPVAPRPIRARPGIASLLTTTRPLSPTKSERGNGAMSRTRSPTRSTRPKLSTRAPSPTLSVMSSVTRRSAFPRSGTSSQAPTEEVGRTRLWQELRGIQPRPRPSTLRSRSREPT